MEFARRHSGRVRTLSVFTAVTPKTIASGIFGPFERSASPRSRTREAAWRAFETRAGRWFTTRLFGERVQRPNTRQGAGDNQGTLE